MRDSTEQGGDMLQVLGVLLTRHGRTEAEKKVEMLGVMCHLKNEGFVSLKNPPVAYVRRNIKSCRL